MLQWLPSITLVNLAVRSRLSQFWLLYKSTSRAGPPDSERRASNCRALLRWCVVDHTSPTSELVPRPSCRGHDTRHDELLEAVRLLHLLHCQSLVCHVLGKLLLA